MNRLILKYKYPITFAILAVLAWVVYKYFLMGGDRLILFIVVAVIVWGIGTCVFIYFWPLMTYSAFKRAVVRHGLGGAVRGAHSLFALGVKLQPARNRNQRCALRWWLARSF